MRKIFKKGVAVSRQRRGYAIRSVVEHLESRTLLTSVLQAHYDLAGDSVNNTESLLTPSTVNTTSFGKQFATPLDGYAYAQPLYVPAMNITSGAQQGVHNVIYVVTEADDLYAIDSNGGNVLWHTSFLDVTNPKVNLLGTAANSTITTVPNGDVGSTDIVPQIGATATPVINIADNAIYIEAKTKQVNSNGPSAGTNYVHTLYKVDLGSGAIDASIIIGATNTTSGGYTFRVSNTTGTGTDPYVNGTGDGSITSQGSVTWGGTSRVYFNALRALSRPGMVLDNNEIYISFASHGDNGPYHGWVLRYNPDTLALDGVLNTEPNGGLGGIWQGGGPPSFDSSGNFYFETGNGSFNTAASNFGTNYSGLPKDADYGDAFVKVVNDPTSTATSPNANGWGMKITDFFSPSNNTSLNGGDTDLGSAGPLVLPDSVGGNASGTAHTHLLVGAGKEGKIYLIDRDNMGGFSPTADHVVQETAANAIGGALSSPAFFMNNPGVSPTASGTLFYQSDYGGYLQSYKIQNGGFSFIADSPDYFSGSLDGSPTISANGTATPIVWALYRAGNQLRAYSALNLATELWTTGSKAGGGDNLSGTVTKFSSPTVADGLVMVADDSYLNVYGPPVPPTSAPAAPGNVRETSTVYNVVNVSWDDLSSNEDSFYIERSTDQNIWSVVGTASANATTFADTTVLATTTYYYRVRAHNSYQGGSYSAYATGALPITTPAAPPMGNGDGLLATYFTNFTAATPLNGPVVLTRQDSSINFNWGSNAPAPGISQSYFSVVWTGTITPTQTGTYTFSTTADDGVRLYFNGSTTPTINHWVNGSSTQTATVSMTAGTSYTLEMDYYQVTGPAVAQLMWTPPTGGQVPVPFVAGTLTGAYHNDDYLRGPADLTRVEATVDSNLDWSNSTPSAAVPNTNFSATYSGMVQAQYSETYTFYTTADDGVDLWVNGQLIVSDWVAESPTTKSATITLSAGQQVPIDMDYYQDGGGDVAQLQWSSAHTALQDIPQSQLYSGVAPAAPSNLTATPTSGTQLNLSWQSNSTIQTGFLIQRRDDGTTAWTTIATVGPSVSTYPDTNLLPGNTYDYQVQATNFNQNSPFSSIAVITMPMLPKQPFGAAGSGITTTSMVATWNDPADSGATGYRVGIALGNADFAYTLIDDPNLSTYTFMGLEPGTEYDVHISAYDIAGYSDLTGFDTTTLTTAPTDVSATADGGQVTLQWTAPDYNIPDISDPVSYNVYRGTTPDGLGTTPYATGIAETTYTDNAATAGTQWYYAVTAVDPAGESAQSAVATPTLLPSWVSGTAATWNAASDTLEVTGPGVTINEDPNADTETLGGSPVTNPNIVVDAGQTLHIKPSSTPSSSGAPTYTVPTSGQLVHLGGLTLGNGANTIVDSLGGVRTHDNHVVLVVGTLTQSTVPTFSVANGKLDLTDNDLIIHNGDYASVASAAAVGRNGTPDGFLDGTWTGGGLSSSVAAAVDASVGVEQNALGVVLNANLLVGYSNWQVGSANEVLRDDGNDVIVKYTYVGDSTLSGAVDSNAATVFLTFYGTSDGSATWATGDTNLDGKIDGNDATAFLTLYGNGTPGNSLPRL